MQTISKEEYRVIPSYGGCYEVSAKGIVKSVERTVIGRDGVEYPVKERTLSPHKNSQVQYLQVQLWRNNTGSHHYVHRLVAQAWIPNPRNLPEVNHKNGNRLDNQVENLEWCTNQENIAHSIATGLKVYTTRLTRDEFIECLMSVIEGESYLQLTQRVPYKVPFLSTKVRAIAKEIGLEDQLNESLYLQKVIRARINGAKQYADNY